MPRKHFDIDGKVFGKLKVIKASGKKDNQGNTFFECLCECGNIKEIRGMSLVSGDTKSCGCLVRVDVLNQKFGRLLPIKEVGRDKFGSITYECICDCGNTTVVTSSALTTENIQSCGCGRKEAHEEYLKTVRKDFGYSSFRNVYLSHRNRAKYRNLDFDLTEDEAKILFENNCFYCGAEPSNKTKLKNGFGYYIHSGIDRVDSTKGYLFDNCVSCCWRCNFAKLDSTLEEFDAWIKQIYHHRNK